MASTIRTSGVSVSTTGPVQLGKGSVKRGVNAGATAAPGDGGVLVDALLGQDLELVDSIPLSLPSAARPKRRGEMAPASSVTLDVPLGLDERAVVLMEDEGEYRWIISEEDLGPPSAPARPVKRRRGAVGVPPTAVRQARFSIRIEAAPTATLPAKRGAPKRGWITDKLVGKVTAFVFRFAAKLIGPQVVRYFERNVRQGLVAISAADPDAWCLLGDDQPLPSTLPADRPARVLLFVHGTFSSTLGSFGALGAIAAGRDFLERALTAYDAVIGFDHPTLSVDPYANATDLLARLQRIDWPHPPVIDIIAFSRGGLTARSLIEQILPGSRWGAKVGRVVFAGCTNGGTQLAEPDNWRRFADTYTNLALGAARALSLIPGAQGWTHIAGEAIRGVGTLVKVLATYAITEKGVPGLAAMEPDGEFVRVINQRQAGQPSAAESQYYAVMSNFEAGAALAQGATPELPPKLLMRIADWGADELYGEPNDLVVHVRSMTHIDPTEGIFVKDRLDYGTNPSVYHTNYFTRDDTAARLTEWLGLSGVVPAKRHLLARVAAKMKPAPTKRGGGGRGAAAKRTTSKPATIGMPGIEKAAARTTAKKAAAKQEAMRPASKAPATEGADRGASGGIKETTDLVILPGVVLRKRGGRRAPQELDEHESMTGQKAAASVVECYFLAEMDSEVVVEQTTSVDVTIAREALAPTKGRESDVKKGPVERAKKLIVQIAERRNFRVEGDRRVEIKVPEPGEPAQVNFDVIPLVAGAEGELWVQVRQGPVPLVTLKLQPMIVAQRGASSPQRMEAAGEITAFPPAEKPLDEMRILESFVGDQVRYHFLLDLPSLKLRRSFESQPLPGARDDYIKQLLNEIGDSWAGEGQGGLDAFERSLKAIGGKMFDQLIPREMQELLWNNRDRIRSVQVFSMEPFVPWELVYLKNPAERVSPKDSRFLGELGLVRWLYEGYPPSSLKIGKDRSVYVIPDYPPGLELPEAADEAEMMKRIFKGARSIPAQLNAIETLLETPGAFDLLHFGGHGEAAGTQSSHARLLIDGQMQEDKFVGDALSATTVEQTAQLKTDSNQPIVVLNACESARRNREFAGMGGFADAFVKAGAGVFVGTHWSVGDGPARAFIETFYQSFTAPRKKPMQLSDAVTKARQVARNAGDATWLAYVVYGHPRCVVERTT